MKDNRKIGGKNHKEGIDWVCFFICMLMLAIFCSTVWGFWEAGKFLIQVIF
jgi:hypothetical protein